MKSRLGLILCGIGLVLALVVTADPMIENKIVRILVICAVFYGIGLGLDIFYKKFILKIMKEQDGDPAKANMGEDELNSLIHDPSSQDAHKGGSFDFKVGDEGDLGMASLMEESKVSTPINASSPVVSSKLEEMADKVANPGQKRTPYENKFEVHDDFILINDKKIPNDPKMMAAAIKSKLAE